LTSVAVAPFLSGDTPLQHYNSLFTLQYLQTFCDAIIYKTNDDMANCLGARKTRGGGGVSTVDMNMKLAIDLAGLTFPVDCNNNNVENCSRPYDLGGEVISEVCPMPSLKFVDLRSSGSYSNSSSASGSSGKATPASLVARVSKAMPKMDSLNRPIRNIATHVLFRGVGSADENRNDEMGAKDLRKVLKSGFKHVDWNSDPISTNYSKSIAFKALGNSNR